MFTAPENWNKLTSAEKRDARFASWMSPEMEFATPEAAEAFKQRIQIIKAVTDLKKPERVPVIPWFGIYPATYAGITPREAMYDYDKLGMAFKKFNQDFMPDGLASAALMGPGKVFDLLDYKIYNWPGHGTPEDTSYQCVEGEYMLADEYDLLINDPSGYFMRTFLPRSFGALAPWTMLNPFTDIIELPFVGLGLIPVGIPPVQESLKTFIEAGQAVMEWISAVGPIDGESIATLGLPSIIGSFSKAPFDIIGDTMRGTRAIMLDMYRRPAKLIEAMERIVPLAIEMGVRYATASDTPMAFIPLHKGADGFMSNKDFERFYWPTLKAVLRGLIEAGCVPYLFVEGGYNQRLDIITDPDIPAGSTIWLFDHTDMKEVKKKLGGWACFGGNVPGSLMKAGTPQAIEAYVKGLIDEVAQDGGYILANGAVLDDSNPENLHALIDTGKSYGVYT
ncbi:MAG TPA: uroporphyrinogen decarboxylase family protein [Anaerolineae bacterium]|nr:uroporphyrinogen decarboxylase family protein [Anaerolineae bacterium]